jgi:hypothetical protein
MIHMCSFGSVIVASQLFDFTLLFLVVVVPKSAKSFLQSREDGIPA